MPETILPGGHQYGIHRLNDSNDTDLDGSHFDLVEDAKVFIGRKLGKQAINSTLQRAWDRFYRIYSAVIRRFVIRQGIPAADVDDCVQDVWHYVLRKLSEFEFQGVRTSFRPWLYRVVASISIDRVRKKSRRREVGSGGLADGATPDTEDSPRDAVAEREWRASMIATLLHEIRGRTSRSNYRIIEMRFLEGKTVTETAETLKMTPRQVWYRQHRVLKKLRELAELYTGGMFRPVESVDAP